VPMPTNLPQPRALPRDPHIDSTLGLLADGYEFISKRARGLDTDAFAARFLMHDVVCVTGAAAAREFYDARLFERAGVMPAHIRRTLVGEGGVQGLDGEAHTHRKAAFMSLMSPESVAELVRIAGRRWDTSIAHWQERDEIGLLCESQYVLCRAACAWAGVSLPDFEVSARTRDLAAMVDAFGGIGWRNWRGRWARTRTELWIRSMIERVRGRTFTAPPDSALALWTWHRDGDGNLLPSKVAAVELLNVLRPIAAVSNFIAFAATALIKYPEYRQRLRAGEKGLDECFVHEVRRYYPFAPFVGARTRTAFESATGHRLPQDQLVILDIYGTNRDARLWQNPDKFFPERFNKRAIGAFDYLPQGGGDPSIGHRCAGEWITIALMRQAVRMLAQCVTFEVPMQDLSFRLSRMPTYPRSGVCLGNVRQQRNVSDLAPTLPAATECPAKMRRLK
jgi:fatty-acid peroxygenase